MSPFEIVTEHEMLCLDVRGPDLVANGAQQCVYGVRVYRNEVKIGYHVIRVTWHLASDDRFTVNRIASTLARLVLPQLRMKQYTGDISLSTTHVNQLLTSHMARPEEQELEIATLLWTLRYSLGRPDVAVDLLIRSTGYAEADVLRVLRYFADKDIFLPNTSGESRFHFAHGASNTLEEVIKRGLFRRFPPAGYFRELPAQALAAEFAQRYVFVLMPFDDAEFPQRRFHQVIKPTLEEVSKVKCWRADENQTQLQITDQIYTQILRAAVIVAEISTENPNVMIEIGIALANNKQVYVFYDNSMLPKVPFYLGKIPYEEYADDAELELKLRKVRLPTGAGQASGARLSP